MIDKSLARGITNQFLRDRAANQELIRYRISQEAARYAANTKGARRAIVNIEKLYAAEMVDYLIGDDGSTMRFCDASVFWPFDDVGNINIASLALRTLELNPKKRMCAQIGLTLEISHHAVQRSFQRTLDATPAPERRTEALYKSLKEANLWAQTLLNAMRVGKVLGESQNNVNLIIPTSYGAFVGEFSPSMSVVNVRSFLGEEQLGPRVTQWRDGLAILNDHLIDLSWVSPNSYRDPRVIATFILAEERGIFTVDWNRKNVMKDSSIDLERAKQRLSDQLTRGQPIHKHRDQATFLGIANE